MVRNEDILKDILLKMNYDTSKTLNEELRAINSLILYDRSKTLSEQLNIPFVMIPYNPKVSEWVDDIIEFFSDPHNVLMAIEIGAMFIAPFTGPFAPVFLAASFVAGSADAAVYYFIDDDPHSAFLSIGLLFLPTLKMPRVFKKSKWFINKYGREASLEVVEKYKNYQKGDKSIKFTDDEVKFLKEAGEDLSQKSAQLVIKQEIETVIKEGFLKIAAKKTIKGLVALIWNTLKLTGKAVKGIGKMGLELGGIYVTFDQLYLFLWGDDEDRQKSEFKQIADLIADFSGEIKEWLISIYNDLIGDVNPDCMGQEKYDYYNDEIIAMNEPIQSADEYLAAKERVYQERQANLPGKKVTLDDIRSGKESLHYGDQGNTVKQIQQMLINLGVHVGDKGADGFFGDDTKDAVIDFQTYPDEYGLSDSIMLNKQDGIVGRETLLAIEKALKLKNNG